MQPLTTLADMVRYLGGAFSTYREIVAVGGEDARLFSDLGLGRSRPTRFLPHALSSRGMRA